jgi:hypothetical protein
MPVLERVRSPKRACCPSTKATSSGRSADTFAVRFVGAEGLEPPDPLRKGARDERCAHVRMRRPTSSETRPVRRSTAKAILDGATPARTPPLAARVLTPHLVPGGLGANLLSRSMERQFGDGCWLTPRRSRQTLVEVE